MNKHLPRLCHGHTSPCQHSGTIDMREERVYAPKDLTQIVGCNKCSPNHSLSLSLTLSLSLSLSLSLTLSRQEPELWDLEEDDAEEMADFEEARAPGGPPVDATVHEKLQL